ncbi:MAG: MFS transporter [Betaproteobacteria bacterium]|nr:MFS transporter [Betaproteobacteria bacterium]
MTHLQTLVVLVSLSSIGATTARFAVLVSAAQAGAPATTVGLLAGLFAGAGALASVPAGRMIDRFGVRRPLLYSAALLVVSMSLGAFWRGLPMLAAIVLLSGLAFNIMVIAFARLAGDLAAPERRTEAFGMLGFGYSTSLLASPMIAGFSIDLFGFTAAFVLFAMVPLGSFVMVWTDRLPWSPAAAAQAAHGNPDANAAAAAPERVGALGLLRAPAMRRLWVCCAMFEAGWMGFTFLLPIVGTQLGFSASRIGLIAGAAGFMLFLTRACLTPLLRRFTPWQLLISGLALGCAGFTGLAFADEFLWMAVCGGLLGAGQGACSPMLSALIYEHSPAHEKGAAMAMRTLISNASQCTTPLIAGALTSAIGVAPVFLLLAAGMAGASWTSRGRWAGRHSKAG